VWVVALFVGPTTEILCLVWRLPHWAPGRTALWHPAFPHLGIEESTDDQTTSDCYDLWEWINDGELVEAHNAWFERGIWTNILVPKYGWTPILHDQWRCSAAKGASHALPRALGDAGAALLLRNLKDEAGHALMMKMCKPRKARKADKQAWLVAHNAGTCPQCKGKKTYKRKPCERCDAQGKFPTPVADVPPIPTLWHEPVEDLHRLWAYCRQDVLAEETLSQAIPDLSPEETELYLLDQLINERGFQLDEDAVAAALELIELEAVDLNGQLTIITDGEVERGTQRARLVKWLGDLGVILENTQAQTVTDILTNTGGMPTLAVEALGLLQELGRSSTGKYERMRAWKCPDGRVRGGLLYHGAATGRWSGAGVQPHNFVRGTVKITQDRLWDALKTQDREFIRNLTDDKGTPIGSVMVALANALRGAICAAPGTELYVADYAAIEARVLLWLAEDPHIDLFFRNEDIYIDMAQKIYARPLNKNDNPQERQLGKATILGCGYGMGPEKFVSAAAIYGVKIDEDFSRNVVYTYRDTYRCVVDLWYAQEEAAIEATMAHGRPVECGKVTWYVESGKHRFLYAVLPSGRRLAFAFPQVQGGMTRRGWKNQLTFMSVSSYTHQWERQRTYGGMIVENLVQAIARDLMADAMLRCEQTGIYRPVLSVHDELISEADAGAGNLHEYEQLIASPPAWAWDCPIAAEGWVGTRYRK
jgi:DNA polymerase